MPAKFWPRSWPRSYSRYDSRLAGSWPPDKILAILPRSGKNFAQELFAGKREYQDISSDGRVFGAKSDTWEPIEHLAGAEEYVARFREEREASQVRAEAEIAEIARLL